MEELGAIVTFKKPEYKVTDDVILLYRNLEDVLVVERGTIMARRMVMTYVETADQKEVIQGRWNYDIHLSDGRLVSKDKSVIKTLSSKFLKTVEEHKGSASFAAHLWDLDEARMRLLFPDLQWPNLEKL